MERNLAKEETLNKDIYGKKYNRGFLVMAIMIGSFVSVLNQSILSTALPSLMKHFNIDASTVQWLTTAFLLVNALMIPLTALLLEKISTRILFMFSMIIFGIGTIICATAPSFTILLVGRIVQAIGAGILAPLISTVLLLVYPPEKRGTAMGLYGLVVCVAPAIGPTLAGLIIDRFSWHYLFYLLIPIIILDLVFLSLFMKDVIPLKNPKIDFLSILLSTIGFGSILYGFSSAGSKGWGNVVVITTILIGLVVTTLFIWRQLSMKEPMLELRVFKSSSFTLTTIIGSILNLASAGSAILVPIFLQNVLGKTAFSSGLILLPGAVLMAIMMLVSGRLFDKIGLRKLAMPGIALLIIGTIPFTKLHQDMTSTYITVVYSIRYLGVALVLMPMQTAGMNALPNKLLPHGSAVVNMSKQVVASLGTAVLITIMSNVTASNSPDKALAASNIAQYKNGMLDATLKGISTTFAIVMSLAILSLIICFFIKSNKRIDSKDAKLKTAPARTN